MSELSVKFGCDDAAYLVFLVLAAWWFLKSRWRLFWPMTGKGALMKKIYINIRYS